MKKCCSIVLINIFIILNILSYEQILLKADSDKNTFQTYSIITSTWGTAPISFDTTTGILTVKAGTLESHSTSQYIDLNNLILKSDVKSVVLLENVVAPVNSSYLFSDNTGNGADVYSYFWTSLKRITGKLDVSNVTDMTSMFLLAQQLEYIDVSTWDTSNVTNMTSLFRACDVLEALSVSSWNVSKVESLNSSFSGLNNIKELDVSNWNTSSLTDMGATFFGMSKVAELDISNWDVSNVKNMGQTFQGMKSITTLDVSKWDVSKVSSIDWAFADMNNLVTLDVSTWNTMNLAYMAGVFRNDEKLEKLVLSSWDTSRVMIDVDFNFKIFEGATNIKEIVLGEKSVFNIRDTGLPLIDTSTREYTGSWGRVNTPDDSSIYENSDSFMEQYDGSKPGTYIWQKQKSVNTKNSIIYVGDSWRAVDNFVSAADGLGNSTNFTSIEVIGSVDNTKAGIYKVKYINGEAESIATITVKENKVSVLTQDSTISVGDSWIATDNFVSATDIDGNEIMFTSIEVIGSVDNTKAGIYKVTYINGKAESIATITVKEKEHIIDSEIGLPVTGGTNDELICVLYILFFSAICLLVRKRLEDKRKASIK